MYADSFGGLHPDNADPATTQTLVHIAKCARCRAFHKGPVLNYADEVLGVMTRYVEAMEASDGNR